MPWLGVSRLSEFEYERVQNVGVLPICEAGRSFLAKSDVDVPEANMAGWFRNELRCEGCRAPPRERAIAMVLSRFCPDWRNKAIHECSPGGWAFSYKLRRECPGYVPTQYDSSFAFGAMDPSGKWRNENLENQTFADRTFDVVITQDVFEHLFHPGRARARLPAR